VGEENDDGRRGEKVLGGGQQGELGGRSQTSPREATGGWVLGSRELRSESIVVVKPVEHRTCDELAVGRLGRGQLRVRVGDAVDALVDTGSVVPVSDILGDHGSQLPLVPDEDPACPISDWGFRIADWH